MHLAVLKPTTTGRKEIAARICLALVAISGVGLSVTAYAIELDLPVQCPMGQACFIQNYFDQELGGAYKDYRCGHLTYDGHKGTDFRVVDEIAMARGVSVIAAAAGQVLGVRDGEPDMAVSARGQSAVAGKEAGNGVVLDHGEGWQTQYSHLRKGSLRVKVGEQVGKGQMLGLIGESGNADFPHVDFSVRRNGQPVDPFWPTDTWSCDGTKKPNSLWSQKANQSLAYIETAVLQAGFAERAPSRLEAQTGQWALGTIAPTAPQIMMWAEVMGANAGDTWRIEITAPNGQRFVDTSGEISGDKALVILGSGKRLNQGKWPEGTYTGELSLMRHGRVLLRRSAITKVGSTNP